ncbi:MAG TPA: UbiH/UbiF/VisC/COQ6 family ubiquinone biosynthesis hydroxylase [Noviherbaspirillum sp.]|jgi:2-octaprenyl-6-methoxyphenol hydroxylase|uniref:UbiH/UbiF/VisC/COQ6 family ubiquinone biosynthesis hydroxylase n=1 Tax=Noviherbaspirillum sp. TaxID=1926288 RepID=UPI002DDD8D13|nr:UbiH/UbiF/VisC/COQ6 family ubiquinone biosynthesis hydroxylase [Noviherbaspirillum sp.]HEV2611769.1 UbiH/UbiF/VisC/COQ6 family ubiquinone biosynthesis hydroxylase [Noviherbaspirillum sp.]
MAADYDIAICGGGPVGMALALLLIKRGVPASRIAVVDAKLVEQAAQDPRSIALSFGSRQILEQIGAWPLAVDEIHEIHVSRRGHFGRTLITSKEHEVPALGYVTRYGTLVTALAKELQHTPVASLRPAQVTQLIERADEVELQFAERTPVTARIAVQAEGGAFSEQAEKAIRRDYQQTAVIAQVTAGAPIARRAFERFTAEGPLALLPQDGGYALVWCVRPDTASRLLALSDSDFLAELGSAFGTRVGRFTSATPRVSYPLGLNAQGMVSARTVAIGNAAQTLHPVAGQGLNLGMRDAVVLSQILSREISSSALQRFATQRHSDRSLTIRITDTMAQIFASAPDGAPTQTMLGLSLGLIDAIKPAKRLLAEQMMFGKR